MLLQPLEEMQRAQQSSRADPAENTTWDWTSYDKICRTLTSEMIAHLATYTQAYEGGEVAGGESLQARKKKKRARTGLSRCKMS